MLQNHIFYYKISYYNQFVVKNANFFFLKVYLEKKMTKIDFKPFPRQKYGSRDSRKIVEKNHFRKLGIFREFIIFC